MKIYRSKISPITFISATLPVTILLVWMIQIGSWLGFSIIAFTLVFLVHLFLTTYYVIEGDRLRVRSGFLVNRIIEIDKIRKVETSKSFLSSPATSFDRIELSYNKFDTVTISPADKSSFVADLKQVNPSIEINLA